MTLARYLAIQILAYGIDMGGFLLILGWSGPLSANALSKAAAGAFAFLAHRHYTFGCGGGDGQAKQALRYIILLALNVPISSAVLSMVLVVIRHAPLAKLCADALCLLATYWLSKNYVFVGKAARQSSPWRPREGDS